MTEQMKNEIKEHLEEEDQAWGLGLIKTLEEENKELIDKLNLQNQRLNELKKENEELKKENGTLKFENHDLCEYIKVLKENEERMKNCFNCKNLKDIGKNCYCEQGLKMYKRNCDKWELAE